MAETAVVSGNPHTEEFLNKDSLPVLEEVWREWDDEADLFEPRPITDRAIQVD